MSDILCRIISFQQSHTWGYPVPHLLGIQFIQLDPPAKTHDSEIYFHFSSERVRVQGNKLRFFWDQIVIMLPASIRPGKYSNGGHFGYEVTEVSIVDESKPPGV